MLYPLLCMQIIPKNSIKNKRNTWEVMKCQKWLNKQTKLVNQLLKWLFKSYSKNIMHLLQMSFASYLLKINN